MRLHVVLSLLVLGCLPPPPVLEVDAGLEAVDGGIDAGLCRPLSSGAGAKWHIVGINQQATDTAVPMVAAGGSIQLALRRVDCCYAFHADEPVCPTWRVTSPVDATFANLTNNRASLVVGAVPEGSLIGLEAQVGEEIVLGAVGVFISANLPLAGRWKEVERRACDGGALSSYQPLEELVLGADGSFQVTWVPFERYVDYWGTWVLGGDAGISFARTGGNVVPSELDGEGRWALEGGRLILSELFLGMGSRPDEPGCTQIFSR